VSLRVFNWRYVLRGNCRRRGIPGRASICPASESRGRNFHVEGKGDRSVEDGMARKEAFPFRGRAIPLEPIESAHARSNALFAVTPTRFLHSETETRAMLARLFGTFAERREARSARFDDRKATFFRRAPFLQISPNLLITVRSNKRRSVDEYDAAASLRCLDVPDERGSPFLAVKRRESPPPPPPPWKPATTRCRRRLIAISHSIEARGWLDLPRIQPIGGPARNDAI